VTRRALQLAANVNQPPTADRPPQTGHAGSVGGQDFGGGSGLWLGSFSVIDTVYLNGEHT